MKTLHTLVGMGSAALAAAVPYPGKATEIFRKGLTKEEGEKKKEEEATTATTKSWRMFPHS